VCDDAGEDNATTYAFICNFTSGEAYMAQEGNQPGLNSLNMKETIANAYRGNTQLV